MLIAIADDDAHEEQHFRVKLSHKLRPGSREVHPSRVGFVSRSFFRAYIEFRGGLALGERADGSSMQF